MTKGELIEIIAQRGFNLKQAELVVNAVFDSMSKQRGGQ